MVDFDFTYDIFKLSEKFYSDYPESEYPELMRKGTRPYTCLLIQTDDYILSVPYRTGINANNKDAFRFRTSERSRNHNSGLDYQKIVIISNPDYLEPTGYSIDSDEYKETVDNINRIVDESVRYVKKYIGHFNGAPLNKYAFMRSYRFTTLKYFHSELGICNGNEN